MNEEKPLAADACRGFAVIARACAAALASEPDEEVVDGVRRAARAVGDARFDGTRADAVLRQRYYDRFFVSASPFFLPLCESSVRGAAEEGGRLRYAPAGGARADHVLACYRAAGFEHRGVGGFDLAVRTLKPDSMVAELAFMASLAEAAAGGAEGPAAARRSACLLRQFAREHAVGWFAAAARCAARADDDFYAGVCALAARAAEAVA